MIARFWTGAVRLADAEAYAQYIHDTGFAEYGRTPGNGESAVTHYDVVGEVPAPTTVVGDRP